jgi:hypothetical protein
MPAPIRLTIFTFVLAPLLCGCGSKISDANYYRVQYGMTEEEVEDLLGPAHQETVATPSTAHVTTALTSTAPATLPVHKLKSWSRGGLTIRVEFDDGVVTGRSADGIPAEAAARTKPVTATPGAPLKT